MFWHSLVCFLDVPTFTSLSRAVKMSCPNFEHNDQIRFQKNLFSHFFFLFKELFSAFDFNTTISSFFLQK